MSCQYLMLLLEALVLKRRNMRFQNMPKIYLQEMLLLEIFIVFRLNSLTQENIISRVGD